MTRRRLSVGIVGAGFGGLGMAIKLRQAGFDIVLFEAAGDIGGTWRANRYPGCACDIQSVLYCFSHTPHTWTQHYSGQPEILAYLHHCADKHGLWPHIRLNTRVTGATWDEGAAVWRVATADGDTHSLQVLVLAQGPLSIPADPRIPGLSGFKGAVMHSAAWDNSVELRGKKVAVVGTGASAIQLVPQLQRVAKELVVFQRTAPWVLPRKPLMPRFAVPAAHGSRLTLWLQRQAQFWTNELLLGTAITSGNPWALRRIESLGLRHLAAAVPDPVMRQQLTPAFRLGCKRILSSDEFYPALCAPNSRLVPSALKEVLQDGTSLVAADGGVTADVDVIVLANGFDLSAPLAQFDVRARGRSLSQVLAAKPQAYYGTAIAGFPNLFTLNGLNTGLGHNSVVFMAECQINLIVQLLSSRLAAPSPASAAAATSNSSSSSTALWVEVTSAAQDRVSADIQARLQRTVWLSGGCDSWYLTQTTTSDNSSSSSAQDVSGDDAKGGSKRGNRGSSVMWPGLCVEYWWKTRRPVAADWTVGKAGDRPAASADESEQHGKAPAAVVATTGQLLPGAAAHEADATAFIIERRCEV